MCPTTDDSIARQRKLIENGFTNALSLTGIPVGEFERVLMKIAYGYDVSNSGIEGVDDSLLPYIRGEDRNIFYRVGGALGPTPNTLADPVEGSTHQVGAIALRINGEDYLGVQIRLFAFLKPTPPVYTVITRRRAIEPGDKYVDIRFDGSAGLHSVELAVMPKN